MVAREYATSSWAQKRRSGLSWRSAASEGRRGVPSSPACAAASSWGSYPPAGQPDSQGMCQMHRRSLPTSGCDMGMLPEVPNMDGL
jgi:hypothetical protein